MHTNMMSKKAAVIILLILVSAMTIILASCDHGTGGKDPLDIIPDISKDTSSAGNTSSEDYVPPDGHADRPVVMDVKNITAGVVVVAGTCEDGAVVTIEGGKSKVKVQSRNGYFIAEVILSNTTVTLLEAFAEVEGKEPSEPLSFTASYNATAEKRIDGYGVSIGADSQLYFDTYLNNFLGSNLLTQTQIRNFKTFINARVTNIENRARGQDVRLLYVLVPDATTVYPEIFPSDVERTTFTTRYAQVSEALAGTNAQVIDMLDILLAAKEAGEFEVFRKADSHLTEYGAYLVYEQIANALADNFPEAAPRPLEQFDLKNVSSIGGNLISYLGITKENYNERLVDLVPKDFSLNIGYQEGSSFNTVNISDVRKYKAPNDYSIYNANEANIVGVRDRFIARTGRSELPSALIYRDDSVYPMIDILAERFNNVMMGRSGDYTVNLTDASRHYSDGKVLVDYIIVIVSESNIQNILN